MGGEECSEMSDMRVKCRVPSEGSLKNTMSHFGRMTMAVTYQKFPARDNVIS